MRLHVTDLKPGLLLQSDTFNPSGVQLMTAGALLDDSDIDKLKLHGIDYVDIEEPSMPSKTPDAILKFSPPESLLKLVPMFDTTIEGTGSIFKQAMTSGTFTMQDVDDLLQPMTEQLIEQKDVVALLLLLDRDDEYTYNHSVQIGILTYYMASWLGYSPDECYNISKAGYLIDIGKSLVPKKLLHKPGKLSTEEFRIMKKHAKQGYDIIMESTGNELFALPALQHHEREDGSGYPYGLRKDDIHPYSRIAAVADVYSAMTTNRIYQSKQEYISVLCELYGLSFGQLNAEVTQSFIKHLLPNFIGKKVLLTTGDTGTIVMNNPNDYFRPLVRCAKTFIDLAKHREIAIVEIYI
ncbi:HD-GYP domain-containing protein [Neobacillus mesonae]|nr:HD-GYP domain-containing protein [Neobacillus mesonae]